METIIYDVIAKRHEAARLAGKPDFVLFYDEDREKAIKAMQDYCKAHGFSIDTNEGTFTVADIVLRERMATGKTISETSYYKIFDVSGRRMEQEG